MDRPIPLRVTVLTPPRRTGLPAPTDQTARTGATAPTPPEPATETLRPDSSGSGSGSNGTGNGSGHLAPTEQAPTPVPMVPVPTPAPRRAGRRRDPDRVLPPVAAPPAPASPATRRDIKQSTRIRPLIPRKSHQNSRIWDFRRISGPPATFPTPICRPLSDESPI